MSEHLRHFEEIYQANKGAVYAYLRGLISHEQDREEAFQETWLTLFRRLQDLRPSHPRAYVLKLARTQVVKRRRSGKAAHCDPHALIATNPMSPMSPPTTDAQEALAQLAPMHREVFTLRHHGGLTYEEIAEVLSVPPGTVASRLHSAVTELRRRLSPPAQLVATDKEETNS